MLRASAWWLVEAGRETGEEKRGDIGGRRANRNSIATYRDVTSPRTRPFVLFSPDARYRPSEVCPSLSCRVSCRDSGV